VNRHSGHTIFEPRIRGNKRLEHALRVFAARPRMPGLARPGPSHFFMVSAPVSPLRDRIAGTANAGSLLTDLAGRHLPFMSANIHLGIGGA